MPWYSNPIKYLHIELSSFCNAACPLCPRHYEGTDIVRSDINLSSITLEKFKKYFSDDFLKQLLKITFCGTLGDPTMSKDCLKISEYVADVNPECVQRFHTNGGARNSHFWKNMGTLSKKSNLIVVFSIDGLEDTNHLYRRYVKWDKLIDNVKSFISHGGKAEWEFLIFDHNEHQINEAKELSKKLNFLNFLPKEPTGFDDYEQGGKKSRTIQDSKGNVLYTILPKKIHQENNFKHTVEIINFLSKDKLKEKPFDDALMDNLPNADLLNSKKICCNSHINQQGSEIYVNAEGIIFPCCFVGSRYDGMSNSLIDIQIRSKINQEKEKFDLNHYSITEIVNSKILDQIFTDSWTKESFKQGKMAICSETCSENSWLNNLYLKNN